MACGGQSSMSFWRLSRSLSVKLAFRKHSRWMLSTVSATLLLLSACFGYGYYQFGSARLTWNYWLGNDLVVSVEDRNGLALRIWNIGDEPVSILGLEATCSCVLHPTTSFPVILDPGKQYSVPLDYELLQKGSALDLQFVWYTSHPSHAMLPVAVHLDSSRSLSNTSNADFVRPASK